MLQALRLYPLGPQRPGNAFYFRGLATLLRIGFDAGKNKGSTLKLLHKFTLDVVRIMSLLSFCLDLHFHNTASIILSTSGKLKKKKVFQYQNVIDMTVLITLNCFKSSSWYYISRNFFSHIKYRKEQEENKKSPVLAPFNFW